MQSLRSLSTSSLRAIAFASWLHLVSSHCLFAQTLHTPHLCARSSHLLFAPLFTPALHTISSCHLSAPSLHELSSRRLLTASPLAISPLPAISSRPLLMRPLHAVSLSVVVPRNLFTRPRRAVSSRRLFAPSFHCFSQLPLGMIVLINTQPGFWVGSLRSVDFASTVLRCANAGCLAQ